MLLPISVQCAFYGCVFSSIAQNPVVQDRRWAFNKRALCGSSENYEWLSLWTVIAKACLPLTAEEEISTIVHW